MKLLYCPGCHDLFKLSHVEKFCSCGRVSGLYVDDLHAEVSAEAVVLGLANSDLEHALRRPDHPAVRVWLMQRGVTDHVIWRED